MTEQAKKARIEALFEYEAKIATHRDIVRLLGGHVTDNDVVLIEYEFIGRRVDPNTGLRNRQVRGAVSWLNDEGERIVNTFIVREEPVRVE